MLYKINTEFKKYDDLGSASTILSELTNLKDEISSLDLSLNTFTPPVFAQIANAIREMPNLKQVRLESILDTLTFEEVTEVLSQLATALPPGIQALELPSNAVSCNFPEEFGKFLEKTPLRVLNLHNCGLGEDGLKKITEHLSRLEDKDELVALDLSKNRINVICPEFGRVFSEFRNLTRFILNANTIEEKSMSCFMQSINNRRLEVLNLTDNFVCGEAIEGLARVFLSNEIRELYLQDIKADEGDIYRLLGFINAGGEESMPGAYEPARRELTLDISCNRFGQDAVGRLEELSEKFQFKRLVVFENEYETVENLRELVRAGGGILIDEEEEEIEGVDVELMCKLKALVS